MATVACPSERCPCASCAGDRARSEARSQGLPDVIEDPAFYRRWALLLRNSTRSAARRRAS